MHFMLVGCAGTKRGSILATLKSGVKFKRVHTVENGPGRVLMRVAKELACAVF